ncbi:MAG: transposase [Anaerolineales bacterium]|nr:transposase [Anaerolineales bacterium]
MKNLDYREYYRRNLPHIQPRGATFLVNFRLAGSLPAEVVERLRAETDELEKRLLTIKDQKEKLLLRDKEQRILFGKWDDALHKSQTGPFWLKDERIAKIVADSILYHDGNWFDILAYCIMPNHGHLVLTPHESSETTDYSLTKIMHNIKRNSANHANKILGRTGTFWQHENYDHYARDEAELERIIKYVLYNPVKAGLTDDWTKWKWSYCKYEM